MSIINISPISTGIVVLTQEDSTGIVVLTQEDSTPTIITINQGQQGPAGVSLSIDNYGDNRLTTSDGTANGLYAESGLTFDGVLRVSGVGVSVSGHTHTSSNITDFNEAVDDRIGSGLFVAGTGINLSYVDASGTFTVGVSGLISNPTNNRILTSRDSTTTGIDAESNATFDGTTLAVSGSITVDNLKLDGNTLSSTNSNGNIIISPSGTGALQRDSGGDARGQYAVDWQTVRSTGTMVAGSNYSVIGGGSNNATSGYGWNTVAGGKSNTSSGYANTVGGGLYNLNSSNAYGTVGGGRGNISSNTYSTVGGGYSNTSSGYASTVGGGANNIASGDYSAILGGQSNNANHNNVFILGSNITSTQANTTFVQNLDVAVSGDIGTLKINNFYHQNLAVATGIADNDLLITIVDPTGSPTTEVIQGSVLRSSLLNQPAQLQFRQGTNAERLLITPASGEPIWTTDSQRFYIGDGTTVGGDFVGPSPYDRGVGTQSIVALNAGCVASGNYSVIGGGENNAVISGSNHSTIGGGKNNGVSGDTSYYSTIGGGYYNSVSGTSSGSSTIGGGSNNGVSGTNSQYSTIGGGYLNNVSGDTSAYSTIGGGRENIVSGTTSYYSTIGGGRSNNVSGDASYYSTIGGGRSNNVSGTTSYYSTLGGGRSNSVSGTTSYYSTIGGGFSNSVSGDNSYFSTIGGGYINTVSGTNSQYSTIPGGFRAAATRYGELCHAAGVFANNGDAQHSILIARTQTLNGNFTVTVASPAVFTKSGHKLKVGDTIVLSTTGSLPTGLNTSTTYHVISAGMTNNIFSVSTSAGGSAVNTSGTQSGTHSLTVTSSRLSLNGALGTTSPLLLILPAETTWTFTVNLSAHNDTNNDGGWWIIRGGIRRDNSSVTTLIGSTITEFGTDSNLSTATVSVTADDINEALNISVGGVASKNIRWVAVVDISQVSYGTP